MYLIHELKSIFVCACAWQSARNNCNQEDVSEFYTIFVLTFQASMGFSVVKVIMGVFLQNTFSVAANDDVKLGRNSLRMRHPLALSIWWTDTVDSCCFMSFHVVSSRFFYLTCGNYLKPGIFILYCTRLLNTDWQASLMTQSGGLPAEVYDELQRSSASNAQVEDATGPSFSPRILQQCHGYRG